MIKKIVMFIYLFFHINKNYFFEKYDFIKIDRSKQEKLYSIWYILKNHFLIILTIVIVSIAIKSQSISSSIIILYLASILFGVDSKDWRLFDRLDFVSEIPNEVQRFFTVLIGNIILKLFVENNLVFLILMLLFLLDFSLWNAPLIILFYIILFAAVTSIYFVIQHSSLYIKKIFSFFSYLFSFLFTTLFSYLLIDFVVSTFSKFTNNLDNKNVFFKFLSQGIIVVDSINIFLKNNYWILFLVFACFAILSFSLSFFILKQIQNESYQDKQESRHIVNNFFLVRVLRKIITIIWHKDAHKRLIIEKELSLFNSIYKYNFRDYFFIFIADRSFALLLTAFLILIKYKYSGSCILVFALLPIILLMDINSSVGVKLIANMSFVTDYNSLVIFNTSGIDLEKLVVSKTNFYYTIKSFSFLLFLLLSNFILHYFYAPFFVFILSNFIIIVIILTVPKMYFTNNLIYCRMDYRDYHFYLDESKILDQGVTEFYPLNILFKVWTLLILIALFFTTIFNVINFNVLFIILSSIYFITLSLVYYIMNRVNRNIMSFIKGGDYSVDIAKIFKR